MMAMAPKKVSVGDLLAEWQRTPKVQSKPKYVQLAEAIEAVIRSGQYGTGDQFPTEVEISNAMPVGLSTVQNALAQLADKGLVTRRRKLGTLIADPAQQAPEVHLYRFRDPATGEMLLPFTRVVQVCVVHAGEFGTLLTGLRSAEAVRFDRLVWVAGSDPCFSSIFMRPEHGADFLDMPPDRMHGMSCHGMLQERFHIRFGSASHRVRADLLSRRACEHLDLAAPHIGLVWEAHDFDTAKEEILVQRLELPRGHRPMEIVESKKALSSASKNERDLPRVETMT